jgi:outer membrane immunogenic protein
MFRVTLLATALTVIASTAFAKDVLRSTVADPVVIKAESEQAPLKQASFSNRWAGAYAGISGSYTMLKDSAPAEGKGATFGAFAGYNIQLMQNVVAGLEVNYGHMGLEFDDGSGVVGRDSLSLRMRGGYAHERFFVYGLIGLERSTATAPFAPGVKFADTALVYGGGVDVAITDRISLGVEYSRSKYEKFDFPTFPLPVDVATQKVQARLTLRFN